MFYPEQVRAGLPPHRVGMLYCIMSDRPDTFVDIAPVWGRRMEALRQHRSQGRDHPELEAFFRRIARDLGAHGGCKVAEGFRRLAPT